MSRLDRLRWRLAFWLCPAIDTALGKRRLERVARACGASKTQAVQIAGDYFKVLREGGNGRDN